MGGTEEGVRVEAHKLGLDTGDVLMLCSDGVHGLVPEPVLAQILHDETDPETACRRLIAKANEQGGTDNITAIVARFE